MYNPKQAVRLALRLTFVKNKARCLGIHLIWIQNHTATCKKNIFTYISLCLRKENLRSHISSYFLVLIFIFLCPHVVFQWFSSCSKSLVPFKKLVSPCGFSWYLSKQHFGRQILGHKHVQNSSKQIWTNLNHFSGIFIILPIILLNTNLELLLKRRITTYFEYFTISKNHSIVCYIRSLRWL